MLFFEIENKDVHDYRCVHFEAFFCRDRILTLAKACKFVQRIRKLDPFDFFIAITFGALKSDTVTLNSLADELPCDLSRTGIHRRFTQQASAFMKTMVADFMALLKTEGQAIEVAALKYFTAVNIIDSTSWKLPTGLSAVFPGYQAAGGKVQLMFDYVTGAVNLVDFKQQTATDQNYARVLAKHLQTGALYLFDRGYTVADALAAIDAADAFFLSRFNAFGLNLYRQGPNGFEKIHLLDEIQHLTAPQTGLDWAVWIGNKTHKTRARLLLTRRPEEVANRCRQSTKQAARKRGKTPSQQSLCLCGWGLWITNIPKSYHGLDVPQLLALYPLRWSVELFFKQMKSTLKLHQTTVRSNPHRLTCEVLGTCIVALFITFCYSCARTHAWRQSQREISFDQTAKYFRRHVATLVDMLYHQILDRLAAHVINLLHGILHRCIKTRQKSRTNSLDEVIQPSRYRDYRFVSVPIGSTPRIMGLDTSLA